MVKYLYDFYKSPFSLILDVYVLYRKLNLEQFATLLLGGELWKIQIICKYLFHSWDYKKWVRL